MIRLCSCIFIEDMCVYIPDEGKVVRVGIDRHGLEYSSAISHYLGSREPGCPFLKWSGRLCEINCEHISHEHYKK